MRPKWPTTKRNWIYVIDNAYSGGIDVSKYNVRSWQQYQYVIYCSHIELHHSKSASRWGCKTRSCMTVELHDSGVASQWCCMTVELNDSAVA